jgi:Carbohydrate-binding family 9
LLPTFGEARHLLSGVNYSISKALPPAGETGAFWRTIPAIDIRHFLPQSSSHRPQTQVRLTYGYKGIHGQFAVEDRFVRCARTGYGSEVWKDSCVEFFVEPKLGQGYFNFEFNCGGAFLVNHIVDPTRTPDGFKTFTRLPEPVARAVQVRASFPPVVEPEIAEPVRWTLEFSIPFALFEKYVGPLGEVAGQTWRGNFFKCAEENSHPHWAAWSPVDEFNFHLPRCFGELRFA